MAKKRKAPRRGTELGGPRDVDPTDAKLLVNSYADVADPEEEYFINQDKILLEDEPRSKRLKSQKEDEIFDSSDEEVLRLSDEDEDEDEEDEDEDEEDEEGDVGSDRLSQMQRARGAKDDMGDEDEGLGDGAGEEGEDGTGYWGSSRQEYYQADALETEADALEEEAEARRLQQKKLSRMSETDFIFDADEWTTEKGDAQEGEEIVTEVLGEVEMTEDMTPAEIYAILQAGYPEFDYLVDEFRELQPLLATYQGKAEGKPSKSLEVVQYWTLGCYVAALASYFAILTSPVRDGQGDSKQKTLDPSVLRDHEVMETLVSCREAWSKVRNLKPSAKPSDTPSDIHIRSPLLEEPVAFGGNIQKKKAKAAASSGPSLKKKRPDKQKIAKAKKLEESLADLSALLPKAEANKKKGAAKSRTASAAATQAKDEDGDEGHSSSDFGEEEALDSRTAEDKAARKRSLRFYTSQIVQKASRRAGAGRDAGGDMDIPHRERLRDRQARLNAEAERRGQKTSKHGEELGVGVGGESEGEQDDAAVAKGIRDDEDEYYDMVAHASRQRKTDRAARNEALKAASSLDRVVEVEQVGEDGKRKITYTIMKNKGLAPKRKKDVRNPRVKKRKKFAEKQKKLKSIRPVYGGGEGRGGYQGELSGIKTGLVKSVKL